MNSELDARLGQLSAKHTFLRARAGLLLLLLSYAETPAAPTALPLPPAAEDIRRGMRELLFGLDTALGNETVQAAGLEKAKGFKAQALALYGDTLRYLNALTLLTGPVIDQLTLRRDRDPRLSVDGVDIHAFLEDCDRLLDTAPDAFTRQKLLSELYLCAPLRMPRDNYYRLLETALLEIPAGAAGDFSDFLGSLWSVAAPEESPGFQKVFPELAAWILEKREVKPATLSDAELEQQDTDLMEDGNSVTEDLDALQALYADACTLVLLYSLTFGFDDLTAEDLLYADSFQALRESYTGEMDQLESAIVREQLAERLTDALSPLLDQANEVGRQVKTIVEQPGSLQGASEGTMKALWMEATVMENFYAEAVDDLYRTESQDTRESQAAMVRDFLPRLRQYLDTLSNIPRKAAMAVLFQVLPLPLREAQVLKYLEQSFVQADAPEKLLILNKAGVLMDEAGLFNDEEDEEECGCGEHTQEDHACSCGEHHHSHSEHSHEEHSCSCGEHHHTHSEHPHEEHSCSCGEHHHTHSEHSHEEHSCSCDEDLRHDH